MKQLLILGIMMLGICSLSAQTISRQVIGAAGSNNENLSFTVGEMAIETAVSGSFILTQGFHQPEDGTVSIDQPLSFAVDYRLYPNPTRDHLTLELTGDETAMIEVGITDMRGRDIRSAESLQLLPGLTEMNLDVSSLATASYMVVLRSESGEVLQTIRFNKLD